MRAILVLPLLAACTEYQLGGEPPPAEPAPATGDPYDGQRTDHLAQRDPVDEVDVLWVVDDSSSMGDDQALLTASFPEFMNFFLGLTDIDYHIGVVSTDMYAADMQGQLREVDGRRWIDPTVFDPIPMFEMMALMGTSGSGDEMGIAAADAALEVQKDTWNAGFYRDDAMLSVITISDEHDHSYLDSYDGNMLSSYLLGLKYEPGLVNYSTIVGPEPSGCATAEVGTEYHQVLEAVGGIDWSICDPNWDELLQKLAMQAAGMKQEFYLSEVPVPETLAVEATEQDGTVRDFELDTDYTYDPLRNSIRFLEYLPPPYTDVDVTYEVERGAEH